MASPLDTYNISQRFFVQKILDLFYENALDSYRVRYNNANTCLREAYKLIKDWKNDRIKRFETVSSVIQELIGLLIKDSSIEFGIINKEDFIKQLGEACKQKDDEIDNDFANSLDYSLHYIIALNGNYMLALFDKVNSLFTVNDTNLDVCVPHFNSLSQEIEFLASEFINVGYSKIFLYQLISRTFMHQNRRTFDERWDFFKRVISEKTEKKYVITFKFKTHNEDDYLKHFECSIPSDTLPNSTPRAIVSSFVRENVETVFKSYEVIALDFYQAIRIANEKLAHFLDILHFSYNDIMLTLNLDVLVVDQNAKDKANVQKIHYFIDGGYINQGVDYGVLSSTISEISQKTFISDNVKDKIKSAIRYLRMGNEAIELEQKYICYWIALEHIFSKHEKRASTFQRMKSNLTNMQIIYYLKRNIQYLHEDVKKNLNKISLNSPLKDLIENNDLTYISNENYLSTLVLEFININPLLAFKLNRKKAVLHSTENLKERIVNHKKNVDIHLIRLYRVRNELMHDAAIIQNIENLTGNLKYYLIFTLNLLLQHFSEIELNGRLEKEIDLQDFFNKQTMLLNHVIFKYRKEDILKIELTENILI